MINTVLLIDDDSITQMLYEFMFRTHSFARQIFKLNNGQEGVDYFTKLLEEEGDLTEKAPELIFLDLDMPVLNGWDFLEHYTTNFRPLFPDTKVVILSSTIDPADKEQAQKYSVVIDFVIKPMTEERLQDLQALPELTSYFQE